MLTHSAHPDEALEVETLCHGPGRNRGRGVHEDHLENEECQDTEVGRKPGEKETGGAHDAPLVANADAAVKQPAPVTQRRRRKCPCAHIVDFGIDMIHCAKLECKTNEEVADSANTEDHNVHHHGMRHVLGTGEACLHKRKARLHEEDQECRQHDPERIQARGRVREPRGQLAAILRVGSRRKRCKQQSGENGNRNSFEPMHT